MKTLNLIQFHYHLKKGGVTTVINNIADSVSTFHPNSIINNIVLSGSCNSESRIKLSSEENSYCQICIKDMNYKTTDKRVNKKQILKLCKEIIASIDYKKQEDTKYLIIGHNITLGKNPLLSAVFMELAKIWKDELFISLIHDFPEENRLQNIYRLKKAFGDSVSSVLYPDLPNYHFGFISMYYYKMMKSVGMPVKKMHYIPNLIETDKYYCYSQRKIKKSRTQVVDYIAGKFKSKNNGDLRAKKILLYPARILERKNIPEAILLIYLLGKDDWQLWITMEANSKSDTLYWQKIADVLEKLDVDVITGVGSNVNISFDLTLNTLFNISDAIITTSVMEGFGFAFCEAWLAGKPVLGRKINSAVQEFVNSGMDFNHMYEEIIIPNFGDFASFKLNKQLEILEKVNSIGVFDILELNPKIREMLKLIDSFPKEIIDRNSEIIKRKYSSKVIGDMWYHLANKQIIGAKDIKRVPLNLHQKLLRKFN